MPAPERSFAEVLQDIGANIQTIVRAEVRLARAELADEARKAKPAGLAVMAGALVGMCAVFFLLLAAVYALSLVMPPWAAALIVAVVSGAAAILSIRSGLNRLMHIDPTPDKTLRSLKETVEWSKQQLK